MQTDHEGKDQEAGRPSRQILKDFFIPKSLADLIYIVICLAAAWYVFSYALPPGAEKDACMKYWISEVCPCSISGMDFGIKKDNITGMPISGSDPGLGQIIDWNITK